MQCPMLMTFGFVFLNVDSRDIVSVGFPHLNVHGHQTSDQCVGNLMRILSTNLFMGEGCPRKRERHVNITR